MVLDIGGGTVDIASYDVTASGAIKHTKAPTGNEWGGTRVNRKFMDFLGDLVSDKGFRSFVDDIDDPKKRVRNKATLEEIENVLFEQQKTYFGDKGVASESAAIKLPYPFMMAYESDLEEGVSQLGDTQVVLYENELRISFRKMEDFFRDTCRNIKSCITSVRPKKVDTVLFAGGFGGCKYLHDKLKTEIFNSCKTYRPSAHELAVVLGALFFRQNPDMIHARVADATYGTACVMPYDKSIHDRRYCFYNDDGELRCDHIFVPFVQQGDILYADKLITSDFTPIKHSQTSMSFEIYTSHDRGFKYVRTPDGKLLSNIEKIGSQALVVKMPNLTGDKSRKVKLTFDFTHTEIQIQAYDCTSGEKRATTVDFLE